MKVRDEILKKGAGMLARVVDLLSGAAVEKRVNRRRQQLLFEYVWTRGESDRTRQIEDEFRHAPPEWGDLLQRFKAVSITLDSALKRQTTGFAVQSIDQAIEQVRAARRRFHHLMEAHAWHGISRVMAVLRDAFELERSFKAAEALLESMSFGNRRQEGWGTEPVAAAGLRITA